MIRVAPAVTVRQNWGEMLNQVQYRHDSVVITRDGEPVAALVNIELFEKLRRMREAFEETLIALGSAYADVPAAEAEAEIAEAVAHARQQSRQES